MRTQSRPLANFVPNHWSDYLHTLPLPHEAIESEKGKEVEEVKEKVKREVWAKKENAAEELKMIDILERLGVSYHFEKEIEDALHTIYEAYNNDQHQDYDLNLTSLQFRLLRQHGYRVPCDGLRKLMKESSRSESEVEGMLSLYEACHVRVHGDEFLDEALKLTTTFLESNLQNLSSTLKDKVSEALRQPVHKGMPRLHTRRYIAVYEKDPSHNPTLLRFAKLDFNFLQSMHLRELQDFASWWKSIHVKASFSRDRFAEAYFWVMGAYFEPKYKLGRRAFIKLFKIASLLDDTCDAYATFEEVQLLNHAIQRWDKRCSDELPEPVKSVYQAILEAFEDVEQQLSQQGRSPYLNYAIQQMKGLGRGHEQDAKWCNEGYVPTYEEYIENGVISCSSPFGTAASLLGMKEAKKQEFEWVTQNPLPKPLIAASAILRLLNDIYSHKFERNRVHVASSVECYMERHGLSREKDAYDEVLKQVENAWKDINEAMLQPYATSKPVLTTILNLARTTNEIYEGEDGYTFVTPNMKDKVAAVLFNPIS